MGRLRLGVCEIGDGLVEDLLRDAVRNANGPHDRVGDAPLVLPALCGDALSRCLVRSARGNRTLFPAMPLPLTSQGCRALDDIRCVLAHQRYLGLHLHAKLLEVRIARMFQASNHPAQRVEPSLGRARIDDMACSPFAARQREQCLQGFAGGRAREVQQSSSVDSGAGADRRHRRQCRGRRRRIFDSARESVEAAGRAAWGRR